MPSAWDANANINLLISINEIQNPKPPNWKEVADKMKGKGYVGFTHEACRQHYQKLRKDAKKASSGDFNSTTPTKKGTSGKVPGSGRGRSKGGNKVASPTIDTITDDDDETFSPPSKKRKRGASLKREMADISDDGSAISFSAPQFEVEENRHEGSQTDREVVEYDYEYNF